MRNYERSTFIYSERRRYMTIQQNRLLGHSEYSFTRWLVHCRILSMSIWRSLYSTVVDALFPIPRAEEVVLSMDGNDAFHTLPRAKKSPIHEACSIYSYKDERVWRLIWALKYKKSAVAARIAAYALFQMLSKFSLAASPLIIVPMPISRRRRRERGYNQCELIADELERLITNEQIIIVRDLLLRTHHKSRQTLKDREERLESAHDIFQVNRKMAVQITQLLRIRTEENSNIISDDGCLTHITPNQPLTMIAPNYLIIVIDDVVTTGSTIRDAVLRLRSTGFTQTFGLSVAH